MTETTTSADGTTIAYDVTGSGPALVLVDGALCRRDFGPSKDLAAALADRFTVYRYDRRGRGESGALKPAAAGTTETVEQEVADLAAVIEAAGGHASVLGQSSGAALCLEAARAGVAIDKIVTYEAPYVLDDSRDPVDPGLIGELEALVGAGKRGTAVELFLKTVGVPGIMTKAMRLMPPWKKMTAVAHTLPYDFGLVAPFELGKPLPEGYLAGVKVPALALAGGKSPAYMTNAQRQVAEALGDGRYDEVPGQNHMVKAAALAPVAAEFLLG